MWKDPGARLEEEGIRWLCKNGKNAQERPVQREIWDGSCVPHYHPSGVGKKG